jgi:hypothetical protein
MRGALKQLEKMGDPKLRPSLPLLFVINFNSKIIAEFN